MIPFHILTTLLCFCFVLFLPTPFSLSLITFISFSSLAAGVHNSKKKTVTPSFRLSVLPFLSDFNGLVVLCSDCLYVAEGLLS